MAKKKPIGSLSSLISQWKLNKVHLASKMHMPVGTFKNKLSDRQTAYSFTEVETEQLKDVLMEMAADIQEVAGMSFNDALKKSALRLTY